MGATCPPSHQSTHHTAVTRTASSPAAAAPAPHLLHLEHHWRGVGGGDSSADLATDAERLLPAAARQVHEQRVCSREGGGAAQMSALAALTIAVAQQAIHAAAAGRTPALAPPRPSQARPYKGRRSRHMQHHQLTEPAESAWVCPARSPVSPYTTWARHSGWDSTMRMAFSSVSRPACSQAKHRPGFSP
jgi:hypothetical protein